MVGDTIKKKDCTGFIINEEDEFLNIFNYKNIKCFKFPNYIYIGQIKGRQIQFIVWYIGI